MALDIEKLINEMTLEEKALLLSGKDNWRTKSVERLALESVMVADGPSGLRKEDPAYPGSSIEAVSYPTGSCLASTFNTELAQRLGRELGEEAADENIHTLLGPAVNIKRTPLGGRNFEYLSEDPLLAGAISTSYVKGVQEKGVGVSLKHFAANNQEYMRMSTSVNVSERALREIYLPPFEMTVKEARPWTIMCSYNRINGTYSCQNKWLLDTVLRKEWGFDGIVMTDWGAMCDRTLSLEAGTELEMPSSHGIRDREIVKAVKEGRVGMEVLDEAVRRLLTWIDRNSAVKSDTPYDREKGHALALEIATDGAVLLKNNDNILPLEKGGETVVIGTFALHPRYQGGGSSRVNPYRVSNPLEEMRKYSSVRYYDGWTRGGNKADEEREREALEAVKGQKRVVIFAGLTDEMESEGFDRHSIDLPSCQTELIEKALRINPDCIIVLFNGSAVAMPFASSAKAILEMNLPGEAVGEAVAAVLYGDREPGGRLSETYPVKIEDNPTYLFYPGDGRDTSYAEDVFVGYRYYDTKKMDVLFPFGHGLGYTTFSLSDMVVDRCDKDYTVTVTVTNTGSRRGSTVVQLYIRSDIKGGKNRPLHELRAFRKVMIEKGESIDVTFTLKRRDFSYWEERIKDWYVEKGRYIIEAGFSSRDIVLTRPIELYSKPLPLIVDEATTVGEVMKHNKLDRLGEYAKALISTLDGSDVNTVLKGEAAEGMISGCPLHSIYSYGDVPDGTLEIIEEALREK